MKEMNIFVFSMIFTFIALVFICILIIYFTSKISEKNKSNKISKKKD